MECNPINQHVPCGCGNASGWRRRAINCLFRALRSVVGLILIAMLATMIIRRYEGFKIDKECERLRAELSNLKRNLKTNSPTIQTKTDVERPSKMNQHECEFLEEDVRDIVRNELARYLADKTGMPDFAMENLGGCVVTTRDTVNFGGKNNSFFNLFSEPENVANRILRPDMALGNCWAFAGSHGTAVIQLMTFVIVTHVTLEHISPKMSPTGDIASAPKTFSLWGLDATDGAGKHKFGTFEYKKDGRPVQTFAVSHPASKSHRIVEVTFHDNHGSEYTCVYRVRIHGRMDTIPIEKTMT